MSRTPKISHPRETTLSRVHMKIEWVITPSIVMTGSNSPWKIVF